MHDEWHIKKGCVMASHEQTILNQLHDIYGMIHRPFWQKPLFYWSLLVGGAVLLTLVGWWYLKRWRQRRSSYAWQKALYELEELEHRKLFEGAQQKLFYFELTRIIKEYLQQRFGVSLMSKTDDELLMLSESLGPEVKEGLQNIFDGVIFIKFAQAAAARERMQRDLLAGKALVTTTRPLNQ